IAAARAPVLNIDGAQLSPDFPNNWAAGLGFGYQYNNWFRTDVTADYEQLFSRSGPDTLILPCQIGAAPVTDLTGVIIGSTPIFAGCSPFFRSRATTAAFLANTYVDLGHWWGFTPYLGAGVGVDVLFQKAQVNWFQGNGVPLAGVTWTDPFSNATFMQNWDLSHSNTSLRFAFAFMGGVSYDVTDHFKLDVGYRWLNLGTITGADSFGNPVKRRLDIHQLRAGVRYVID
ncbi:MAG: porin family protein, partial [Methylocystis sp.]|nr:porin family protein [Methylocystis sp.]